MVNIHQYWVYIMSNKARIVLYVGITNDLYRRYLEHKEEKIEGFTQKYRCYDLLYYEESNVVNDAIACEKEIKAFRREKKEKLIATKNPAKRNLAIDLEWI
ncbi:MAG: GIY-YIG nuclease family protein [Bacteroidales bacterium]|nr:GIY-YIG nuclease family protein [Bacteroidales bacterium]